MKFFDWQLHSFYRILTVFYITNKKWRVTIFRKTNSFWVMCIFIFKKIELRFCFYL